MHRNTILCSLLLVLLLSMVAMFVPTGVSAPEDWDFPRIDIYNMTIAYPRTYALSAAQSGVIENFVGFIATADVDLLRSSPYYWNISLQPGYHMCYLGINCRDVTPSTSGEYWPYHNRTPGFELYPLNISQFRMALEIIVSGYKTDWIAEIYGYICIRLDQVIPPANEAWFNPCIPEYPSDWTIAENMLLDAGFQWDLGTDGQPHTSDDKWVCPNGMVLWDGSRTSYPKSDRFAGYVWPNPIYGIIVLAPGTALAPTSWDIACRHAAKWNKFFCGIDEAREVGSPAPLLFMAEADQTYELLTYVPWYNRDHDIYFLCFGLGRDPDYLYDLFHPDVDVPGGDNSPGLVHDGLDRLLATMKFWKFKDYEILVANAGPPCEPITVTSGTTFGPYGPFDAEVDVSVQIEHVDLALGVYDEELVEGVHYTVTWTTVLGKYYVSVNIISDINLGVGEDLQVRFPEGTYHRMIFDEEEMRTVVYLLQWKLYYLVPYLPIYSRNYTNGYITYPQGVPPEQKTDWPVGYVESKGFGSEPYGATTPWTFNNLHWKNTPVGGTFKYHVAGRVGTLNPIIVLWVYEVTVLNRMFDSARLINPYLDQKDIPWAANDWDIEEWIDPRLGVKNGMIITFYLREDITWQDGDPVTAEDVAWNFEFLESLTPPEYLPIWEPLVKYEVVDDYCIKLFVNDTGYWKFLEFADSILNFPRTAWEAYMGDYDPETFEDYDAMALYKPWTVPHPNPPSWAPDLTMLYGTGPYYYPLGGWDPTIGKGVIRLQKNTEYWARKAAQKGVELGMPGIIFGVSKKSTSPTYYTFRFTNVNPFQPWTINNLWISVKDCLPPFARPGPTITINPYDSYSVTVGPQLPKVTGDLGGGTPPRFFDYDGVCDSKDYSLFLRALKKAPGDIIPEKFLVYIAGAIRFWK